MKRILVLSLLLSTLFSVPVPAQPLDELHIRRNANDELHVKGQQKKTVTGTRGAKYNTDEFHLSGTDIEPNDGYKSGTFDELHINSNYRQNVWKPEKPVIRFNGFDEFHLPDEM